MPCGRLATTLGQAHWPLRRMLPMSGPTRSKRFAGRLMVCFCQTRQFHSGNQFYFFLTRIPPLDTWFDMWIRYWVMTRTKTICDPWSAFSSKPESLSESLHLTWYFMGPICFLLLFPLNVFFTCPGAFTDHSCRELTSFLGPGLGRAEPGRGFTRACHGLGKWETRAEDHGENPGWIFHMGKFGLHWCHRWWWGCWRHSRFPQLLTACTSGVLEWSPPVPHIVSLEDNLGHATMLSRRPDDGNAILVVVHHGKHWHIVSKVHSAQSMLLDPCSMLSGSLCGGWVSSPTCASYLVIGSVPYLCSIPRSIRCDIYIYIYV